MEVFCGFPQLLNTIARIIPCLGHVRFLPNPLQFIYHPTITAERREATHKKAEMVLVQEDVIIV
jgi:hypothetical protein